MCWRWRSRDAPSVQDHSRKDLKFKLGFDDDVLSEDVRLCEVRNWVSKQVIPFHSTER